MSLSVITRRLREIVLDPLPLPGGGQTAKRHARLMLVGREDLSLARLTEAHWDAVAILAEAGRDPLPGALYGVWASEIPGKALALKRASSGWCVSGCKMFCSGAGIVDRALVTVGSPMPQLIDMDLSSHSSKLIFDHSAWKTTAFAETKTASCTFDEFPVSDIEFIGNSGWYLERPGFWHGACGPAACWAGGAEGLLDYAVQQSHSDAHTMAHLGAISADIWAMRAYLLQAGEEIDAFPMDVAAARILARTVRHLVEQACTDTLRRLVRAYGPHPLAMQTHTSRRYQELDLYVRQSHAERDLEALGLDLHRKS